MKKLLLMCICLMSIKALCWAAYGSSTISSSAMSSMRPLTYSTPPRHSSSSTTTYRRPTPPRPIPGAEYAPGYYRNSPSVLYGEFYNYTRPFGMGTQYAYRSGGAPGAGAGGIGAASAGILFGNFADRYVGTHRVFSDSSPRSNNGVVSLGIR